MSKIVIKLNSMAIPAVVKQIIAVHGVDIYPQFPGALDPALACWFITKPSQTINLEPVADLLRQVLGVESAYVQPSPVMP